MEKRTFMDAGTDVHVLAQKYMKEHEGVSYSDSVEAVLASNTHLNRGYEANPVSENKGVRKLYTEAHDSLHEQAEELAFKMGIPYMLAFTRVLTRPENAQKARAYIMYGPEEVEAE